MPKEYQLRKEEFNKKLKLITNKYNKISFLRIIIVVFVLFSFYEYFKNDSQFGLYFGGFFLISFLIIIKFHSKISFQKKFISTLIEINQNELDYLFNQKLFFEDGQEFENFNHSYSFDLDVFGTNSLFQNLNRTATYIGKKTLADRLKSLLETDEILKNQEAIQELRANLSWRQEFFALSKMSLDKKENYTFLLKWVEMESKVIKKASRIIAYTTPILFVLGVLFYFLTSAQIYLSILSYIYVFNLGFTGLFLKQIKNEIAFSTDISTSINQYSKLIQKIENQSFTSKKMIELQNRLLFKQNKASVEIKKLSELFSKMDSISNFVSALLLNGTILYNFHALDGLLRWKKDHANVLKNWLEVIGELEFLNSLSNFSYNNPDYAFPKLNSNFEISFENLSHPLLNSGSRIGNNCSFNPQSFMILTGSNMSGKSTFLRSLGVNMVLSGIGSPVCASAAFVHPLTVLVSMRLSDSLSDSESYFFAEIKRLKLIMNKLECKPAFVLLDEILRGTNSDDKRNGTIEVIKKVISKDAIGAIATHDIEVCLTTNDFPKKLTNKCFEVSILNDELHFDYKLRDGICQNKSATFLMKKLGVI